MQDDRRTGSVEAAPANDLTPANPGERDQVLLIGIGASAGGLEALRELVGALPQDLPAIYVVAQHMGGNHRSMLADLLERETKLKVAIIDDGVTPEPGYIYVTPPNHDTILDQGRLVLRAPGATPGAPKPSVDRLFRSLAAEAGRNAIGIVMSGTGHDGSYGIEEIRAAGGVTIAQDEQSARYFGMPGAAIQTDCVDYILSPGEIGEKLRAITLAALGRDSGGPPMPAPTPPRVANDALSRLLSALQQQCRVNFSEYKRSTVSRRIERRMIARGCADINTYVAYTKSVPAELDELFRDMLISVTAFFRDPDDFAELKNYIETQVLERSVDRFRIWVPGCATGEEAYSIAILVEDAFERAAAAGREVIRPAFEMFATDIDERALEHARRGFYSEASLEGLNESYIERYFTRRGDSYQISRALRERIIFSTHNLCDDPPFRNIDIVSCRNLLIYFEPTLQKRVLQRLHYSLNETGVLFIGRSESIRGLDEHFQLPSNARRLFRRRVSLDRQPSYVISATSRDHLRRGSLAERQESRVGEAMFKALAESLGSGAMLVSQDCHIKRAFGDLSRHTTVAAGPVRTHLSSLMRPPMSLEIQHLAGAAISTGRMRKGTVRSDADDPELKTQVQIYPVVAPELDERHALVVFREWRANEASAAEARAASTPEQSLADLELELNSARESLQTSIEELETSNEELQALNEEFQSTNEELQAANEELETANEELQSANEELTTVNDELSVNAQELELANQYLDSIANAMPSALLVFDPELNITRYNPSAAALFGIRIGDPKLHITHLRAPPGYPSMTAFVGHLIEDPKRVEEHVETDSRSWILSAAPFYGRRDKLLGIIVTCTEDTDFVTARRELELIFDTVPVAIMNRNADGEILNANRSAEALYGFLPGNMVGANIADLGVSDPAKMQTADRSVVLSREPLLGEVEDFSDSLGRRRTVLVDRVYAPERVGRPAGIFSVARDITQERHATRKLEEQRQFMELAQRIARIGYWQYDLTSNKVTWSDMVHEIHGTDPNTYTPTLETAIAFYHPDDRPIARDALKRVAEGEPNFDFTLRLIRADGTVRKVNSHGRREADPDGRVATISGIFADITDSPRERELRQAEELRRTTEELRRSNAELERFSYVCSHDMKEPVRTIEMLADLLTREDAPISEAERHDYLARIGKNTARLGEIIESLLAFSRVDQQVEFRPVNLQEVCDEVCEALSFTARKAQATIEAETLPIVWAARVHMRQLLQNLVGNALKFGGSDTLLVRVRSESRGGSTVFIVEDSGPGVPELERKAIFSVFVRLHRADEVSGTGLGLSICNKIVTQYGGRIWCEQSDLGGARFCFTLPACEAPVGEAASGEGNDGVGEDTA